MQGLKATAQSKLKVMLRVQPNDLLLSMQALWFISNSSENELLMP
jgi:hypothetical protein